jgi:NodT family efflux transporter outer membrane factor (OMF) lipoprotein
MKTLGSLPILLVFTLAACSLYKARDEVHPPVSAPPRFSDSGTTSVLPDRWWEDFGDAELNQLVDSALSGNLDLGAAWARLDQAAALARQAGARLWPEVTAEADASRAQSVFFAGEGLERTFKSDRLLLTAAATYEVDLWKRVWSTKRASEFDLRATREDLEIAAMTLAAQMANAWVSLIEQNAQRDLLTGQEGVGERFLRLTELRFSQGLASALDVYQQRAQLASTRSQVPLVEAQIGELRNRIAVLRGEPPGGKGVTAGGVLPEPPPLPATGLPGDLLQRRPDVRAAELRVAAADHRVAAAVADRLPAIRLTARGGYQSFSPPDNLFDTTIWTIAGNLAAPLIDGGRRRAEVDRTKAVVAERLNAYGQVFLQAMKEVEDALLQEQQQREHVAELERQAGFSRHALEEAQARYVAGLSDYLPVLTALEALQRVERSELTARRQLLSFRIQLYRALGGSWMNELERGLQVSKRTQGGER